MGKTSNAQKIRDIIAKLDSALVDIDALKQPKNAHSSKMHDRAREFVESAIESLEEM